MLGKALHDIFLSTNIAQRYKKRRLKPTDVTGKFTLVITVFA